MSSTVLVPRWAAATMEGTDGRYASDRIPLDLTQDEET
jgi:hypothetical protein